MKDYMKRTINEIFEEAQDRASLPAKLGICRAELPDEDNLHMDKKDRAIGLSYFDENNVLDVTKMTDAKSLIETYSKIQENQYSEAMLQDGTRVDITSILSKNDCLIDSVLPSNITAIGREGKNTYVDFEDKINTTAEANYWIKKGMITQRKGDVLEIRSPGGKPIVKYHENRLIVPAGNLKKYLLLAKENPSF